MLTRRFAFPPISDEWLNCIWRFGVKEGKEFTLSNPLFTLDNMPFFMILKVKAGGGGFYKNCNL